MLGTGEFPRFAAVVKIFNKYVIKESQQDKTDTTRVKNTVQLSVRNFWRASSAHHSANFPN